MYPPHPRGQALISIRNSARVCNRQSLKARVDGVALFQAEIQRIGIEAVLITNRLR
jgi:hypothetical protein